MMITMEHTQENEVVNFPIQDKSLDKDMTAWEVLFQVQLSCTRELNRVHHGEIELTQALKENCHRVNEISKEYGYPLMDLPF